MDLNNTFCVQYTDCTLLIYFFGGKLLNLMLYIIPFQTLLVPCREDVIAEEIKKIQPISRDHQVSLFIEKI